MARYKKHPQPSPETRDEAKKIARGTQRPGQTKEQTKLIAQGIEKGIDQYKKEQKAKARELDRQRRQLADRESGQEKQVDRPADIVYRQHWLPWLLLAATWIAIVVYIVLFA